MKTGSCKVHKLIVDVALFARGQVLMVTYSDTSSHDGQPGWFIPDDLITHLEHPEDAARRVLRQQLGLKIEKIRLGHIDSFTGNDGTWHLAFHYGVDLDGALSPTPSKDIETAQWFALDRLPSACQVAHHGWALGVLKKFNESKVR